MLYLLIKVSFKICLVNHFNKRIGKKELILDNFSFILECHPLSITNKFMFLECHICKTDWDVFICAAVCVPGSLVVIAPGRECLEWQRHTYRAQSQISIVCH